jgi:hypothetical protein
MAFIKKGQTLLDTQAGFPPSITATIAKAETDKAKALITHAADVQRNKGRDFDAEARGKTRCALEEAWAQSPLLPMLVKDPNDRAELHLILDEIVTERMKRVFPNG